MLWRRLNVLTLLGLIVVALGAWMACDARLIHRGGMVPVMEPSREGWEETGQERWATARERRREQYVFSVLLFVLGTGIAYHGNKRAYDARSADPDRFRPWLTDKAHRAVAGSIFVVPAALVLPRGIEYWLALVQRLPGVLQAVSIPVTILLVGLPFCVGGILARRYWSRFGARNRAAADDE